MCSRLCSLGPLDSLGSPAQVIALVEMMLAGGHDLVCFVGGADAVIGGLRARMHETVSDRRCGEVIDSLIARSLDSWRTRAYDAYQRWSQGVH